MTPEIHALLDVFRFVVPELILAAAACVLFLGATFRIDRHLWAGVALAALIAAALALAGTPAAESIPEAVFRSTVYVDQLALLIKSIAIGGGILLVLLSWEGVPERQAAEYHACLLLITAGVCLTGAANELVTLFLALELVSIPTYVLLYLPRSDRAAQEAAMKYFLLSVFSSAFVLFGFSYLYGMAGTTNMPGILRALSSAGPERLPGLAPIALVMIVAGLGFRITAVPFHFYAPDVYQGTTPAAAGLLAFVPKIAGFAALTRVLGFVGTEGGETGLALGVQVPMLLYILAAVTMSLGNLLALLQDNLKRLLAYSSVAHAGYMLIGLAIAPDLRNERLAGSVDALWFYLVAYTAMTLGAFAVIEGLSQRDRPVETVDDLAGLSHTHPAVAFVMTLCLFSLIGMPLTAGFTGKLQLFFGAVAAPAPKDHPWLFKILALVAALNAAVGAWYYLRIIAVMYLRTALQPLAKLRALPTWTALWLCAILTLWLGIYPAPLAQRTRDATHRELADKPSATAAR